MVKHRFIIQNPEENALLVVTRFDPDPNALADRLQFIFEFDFDVISRIKSRHRAPREFRSYCNTNLIGIRA